MATTSQAACGGLQSTRIPQSRVVEFNPAFDLEQNEVIVVEAHLDTLTLQVGSTAASRLGDEDVREVPQTRHPAPRAGPAFVQPSSGYLSQVVDTLRACGILPAAPARDLAPEVAGDDSIDDDMGDTDNGDVDGDEEEEELEEQEEREEKDHEEEEEEQEEVDDEDEEDEEEEVQRWNVWDENKESWGEVAVISKPSRRVARKGRPVQLGKQAGGPPVAVSTIEANGKGEEKAVAENTPAVGGDSITATASRSIVTKNKGGAEPPVAEGEGGETEERHKAMVEADNRKAKASKRTSEGIIVAVQAAQKDEQTKGIEHSIGTRRRKEAVKATIRARKVARVRAAGRKPAARGRGAAKAAVTGSALATGRDSPVLPPPKTTSEVKLTTGERPPLSTTATHNTPSRSSKEDGGYGSVSSGPSLTIELLATGVKGVVQEDEATDANAKEDPSIAATESAEEADENPPGESARNAEKLQAPKSKEAKAKPTAGRPKRKELHEDSREERYRDKRAKKGDTTPAEEEPKPRIMIHIQKGITREEKVGVEAEVAEESKGNPATIPETIENGGTKLRRSARSKKATFKTRHQ